MNDEPKIELGGAQLSALEHAHKMYGLGAGWDIANDYVNKSLIELGLISGRWIGSVSEEPIPFWDITREGREVLKQYGKL